MNRDCLFEQFHLGSKLGIFFSLVRNHLENSLPTHGILVSIIEFAEWIKANTSIGQGDVLVTPLQMANLMVALANGGTLYQPRLVRQIEDSNGQVLKTVPVITTRTIDLSNKYMANLKEAMIVVVDDGTATYAHCDNVKIAAKTGTAQLTTNGKSRQIAWFCGYLPADKPKYAFAFMVEGTPAQDLHGGKDAGGLAKLVFNQLYGK